MTRVPPIVLYRPVAGPAYLIAWQLRRPDQTWWARILWLEISGDLCRGKEAWVIAEDVQPIPGQDYANVPCDRVMATRPSDLTDPRDPDYLRPAEERAIVNQQPREEEPDFLVSDWAGGSSVR